MNQPRMISIATATPGWFAEYDQPDGTATRGPIAAWVLVEHPDGITEVCGIDPTGEGWSGDTCSDASNFAEYVYLPDEQ